MTHRCLDNGVYPYQYIFAVILCHCSYQVKLGFSRATFLDHGAVAEFH